jgi:hypothetical protein
MNLQTDSANGAGIVDQYTRFAMQMREVHARRTAASRCAVLQDVLFYQVKRCILTAFPTTGMGRI